MVPSVKLGCAVMEGPARPVVVEEVTTALEEGPACGIDLAIVAATCAFMWGVTLMPFVVLPGWRMWCTRGRRGVSSSAIALRRRDAVSEELRPGRTRPVVNGGVAIHLVFATDVDVGQAAG
jgi:hypothetical protein